MRLRLFTPRQPIPDVETTSEEWKPDPEIMVKHNDLYARARESEYETPIFDNGQHDPDNDNAPEITVRHDIETDETSNIPGTIHDGLPEFFTQTDEVVGGTDTDHYMESDADRNSEQLSPTNANSRSTKHSLRQNHKPNCNGDYRY